MSYRTDREVRAWHQKIEPERFEGSDELHPPVVVTGRPTATDRKELESEEWYQYWLKLRARQP